MKARLIILGVLVVVLIALAFVIYFKFYRGGKEPYVPIRPGEAPGLQISGDNLFELRSSANQLYSLEPDRRVMEAVADIHAVLKEEERQEAEAVPAPDGWLIRYKSKEVGKLPLLPDFGDLMSLLVEWAGANAEESAFWLKGTPASGPGFGGMSDRDAFKALEAANGQWNDKKPAALARGAQALAYLALCSLDLVETADSVPARALAALAMLKARDASGTARTECMLAQAMGYTMHAHKLAADLDPSDPVRLYVDREDAKLAAMADMKGAGSMEGFFHLLRLSEKRDLATWTEWMEAKEGKGEAPTLPILKTAIQMRRFEANVPVGLDLADQILGEMENFGRQDKSGFSRAPDEPAGKKIERFIEAAGDLKVKKAGPFLDAGLARDYFRAYFYSALFVMGEHYRHSLASIKATKEFSDSLDGDLDDAGKEFQLWYRHLARSMDGSGDIQAMRLDLSTMKSFGSGLLLETFDEVKAVMPLASPEVRGLVKKLMARLDTRPEHRVSMAMIAREDLLSFRLTEMLLDSLLKVQYMDNMAFRAWYLAYQGEWQKIESMLEIEGLTPKQKSLILENLAESKNIDPELMKKHYKDLIAKHPATWSIRDGFIEYLEDQEDYETALEVAAEWISLKGRPESTFDEIFARIDAGRMCYHLDKVDTGLKIMGEADESMVLGAVVRKAMLLEKAGKKDEALALARKAYDRYPDSIHALSTLAGMLWRGGRNKDAAKLVQKHRYPIYPMDWRSELGKTLLESFKDRDEEAIEAVSDLMSVGFASVNTIGQVAVQASKSGQNRLAFEIQSKLQSPGLGQIQDTTKAYGFLKAWKGKDAALAWISKQVDEKARGPLCMFAFNEKQYELLWDFSPAVLQGEKGDYYWLMRAAASIMQGAADDSHRQELEQHFKEAGGSRYHLFGRYLLGMASDDEMATAVVAAPQRCEAAFFMGLKAEAAGKLHEAADWYNLALELGTIKMGEYYWAHEKLYAWMTWSKSLERIATEKGP